MSPAAVSQTPAIPAVPGPPAEEPILTERQIKARKAVALFLLIFCPPLGLVALAATAKYDSTHESAGKRSTGPSRSSIRTPRSAREVAAEASVQAQIERGDEPPIYRPPLPFAPNNDRRTVEGSSSPSTRRALQALPTYEQAIATGAHLAEGPETATVALPAFSPTQVSSHVPVRATRVQDSSSPSVSNLGAPVSARKDTLSTTRAVSAPSPRSRATTRRQAIQDERIPVSAECLSEFSSRLCFSLWSIMLLGILFVLAIQTSGNTQIALTGVLLFTAWRTMAVFDATQRL